MSQRENVYQFIDLPRVDPPKIPLATRQSEFVEIYQPFTEVQATAFSPGRPSLIGLPRASTQ